MSYVGAVEGSALNRLAGGSSEEGVGASRASLVVDCWTSSMGVSVFTMVDGVSVFDGGRWTGGDFDGGCGCDGVAMAFAVSSTTDRDAGSAVAWAAAGTPIAVDGGVGSFVG